MDLIVAEILFRTGIAVYDPDIRAIFLIVLMLVDAFHDHKGGDRT